MAAIISKLILTTSKTHMHIFIMSTTSTQGFKGPLKTVGSWLHKLYTVKCDERTDRQT